LSAGYLFLTLWSGLKPLIEDRSDIVNDEENDCSSGNSDAGKRFKGGDLVKQKWAGRLDE